MMAHLQASVGAYGGNRRADVRTVQRLLTTHGVSSGPIDGLCGRLTMGAILHFQRRFMSRPDGRVDPIGPTLRHLNDAGPSASAHGGYGRSSIPHPAAPRPTTRTAATPTPRRAAAAPAPRSATPAAAPAAVAGANYKQRLPLPARGTINVGLQSPSNREMQRLLGEPRNSYNQECRSPTNERIKGAMDSVHFG